MEHAEALRIHATERYLLGELSDEERDRFEEHYFECVECAADVKAGVAFVDGARSALSGGSSPASLAERPRPWKRLALFWPMPAGTAAALVLLAAVSLHQALIVIPGLRGEIENATALQPTSQHFLSISRSAAPEIVTRRGERTVTLVLSRASDRVFSYYRCETRDAHDRAVLTAVVSAPADGEIHLSLPVFRLPAGAYKIAVFGLESAEGSAPAPEVARYPFTLRPAEDKQR